MAAQKTEQRRMVQDLAYVELINCHHLIQLRSRTDKMDQAKHFPMRFQIASNLREKIVTNECYAVIFQPFDICSSRI